MSFCIIKDNSILWTNYSNSDSQYFVLTPLRYSIFPANCAPHKIVAVPTTAPPPKWLWITHSGSLSARTFTHPRASSAGQPIFPATTKPLARAARSFLCPAKNEEKSEEEGEEEEQRDKGYALKVLRWKRISQIRTSDLMHPLSGPAHHSLPIHKYHTENVSAMNHCAHQRGVPPCSHWGSKQRTTARA